MSIFRAYDIRGIVGETLTESIAYQIGQAIGSEAADRDCPKIVVARDGRLSGPVLIESLIEGLMSTGRQVIDIGQVPTPVLYFATYYLETGSGVMLTGSHNPANYNGLKMMIGGETLFSESITNLKTRIDNNNLISGKGSREQFDIKEIYLNRITGDVKLSKPFKIVVDCGNGVAGELAPRLLKMLGCEVIELFCEIDGHFPNHHPDPTQLKNLQDLISKVKETNADLGLGFDGDGDRLGVVDNQGKVIWADRQMMLYAKDILSRHPHSEIIFDVKCSRHLSKVIEESNGIPVMWKTGHSFMKTRLKESGLLAGEMSGHIFFKERWYGFDDALYTAARLLEILSKIKESPTEVFEQLPDAVSTPEIQVYTNEGENFSFMTQFSQQAQFPEAEQISTIDGLRVDFKHGWGLIRPSNTTPCLVLRFEADNEANLKEIQQQFRLQMLAVDSHLQLPF
jgi:phosphomannomutase / phosphoglucomutase